MRMLIAGGGPTGLTLGIELARRGVEVRVVDKAERRCWTTSESSTPC
jgi:2-polyprenyl-6-methoxyphenol hydroxylase-like FAD-dependent oxidoreductase